MAVSMTPNFNKGDLKRAMQGKIEDFRKSVLMALQRAGEEFIASARSVDTYKDQTGNLRSSIGYVILKDGEQIFGGFPGKTPDGVARAKQTASEVSSKFHTGYVLIVVAGMDYAAYVEAKGYDVLTGSSPAAEELLKKAMAMLQKKADNIL